MVDSGNIIFFILGLLMGMVMVYAVAQGIMPENRIERVNHIISNIDILLNNPYITVDRNMTLDSFIGLYDNTMNNSYTGPRAEYIVNGIVNYVCDGEKSNMYGVEIE